MLRESATTYYAYRLLTIDKFIIICPGNTVVISKSKLYASVMLHNILHILERIKTHCAMSNIEHV